MNNYEIRLEGLLDESWGDWFGGLSVTTTATETVLFGPIPDQAALFGLLTKIRDLGLPLIAVNRRTTASTRAWQSDFAGKDQSK